MFVFIHRPLAVHVVSTYSILKKKHKENPNKCTNIWQTLFQLHGNWKIERTQGGWKSLRDTSKTSNVAEHKGTISREKNLQYIKYFKWSILWIQRKFLTTIYELLKGIRKHTKNTTANETNLKMFSNKRLFVYFQVTHTLKQIILSSCSHPAIL